MAETIFTVFLLLGIFSLTAWIFSGALRTVAKLICNCVVGLCLLFLLDFFGIGIPFNGLTMSVALFGGGFGVAAMLLLYLLF